MNMSARIGFACVFGLLMVAGAFYLSTTQPTNTTEVQNEAALALTGSADRQFIPITDEDNDGVPDWEESLDFVEPIVIDRIDELAALASSSATSSRPDNHTDRLAISLMEQILDAKQAGSSGSQTTEFIVRNQIQQLRLEARDDLYTVADITVSPDSSPAAVRQYVNQLANITLSYPLPEGTQNELIIMNNALVERTTTAFAAFRPIADSYDAILADTLALPVPRSYQQEHLDLINTINAVAIDIRAMENTPTDPVWTMVRMKRYEDDLNGLYYALYNIGIRARDEALTEFTPEDPVFRAFAFVIRNL